MTNLPDLEDIRIIAALKVKYGRTRLLIILEKLKRLIE